MRNEPSACIFGNGAKIQAVVHTVGHRQQLTVSVSVQNCWKCFYLIGIDGLNGIPIEGFGAGEGI